MADRSKFTVELPQETLEKLMKIAQANGFSMNDAITQAANTESFLAKQEQAGRKILLENTDRTFRQVTRK